MDGQWSFLMLIAFTSFGGFALAAMDFVLCMEEKVILLGVGCIALDDELWRIMK